MSHRPFRLGVLTALWGRPDISGPVLRHYAGLDVPCVEMVLVAVRSPEDPAPTPDVEGWHYVEAPNRPLSDKWNAGASALPGDLDALMIVGSDDLVTVAYIAAAVDAIWAGAEYVYADGCVFYDAETGRARARRLGRVGAGRVLTRALLDRLGGSGGSWVPWPSGLDRRLDGGMDRRIAEVGGAAQTTMLRTLVTRDNGAWGARAVVDVKSPVNLWSYDQVATHGRALDPSVLTRLFPSSPFFSPRTDAPRPMPKNTSETVEMVATATFRNKQHEGLVRRNQRFETNGERAKDLEKANLARPAGDVSADTSRKEDKAAATRETKEEKKTSKRTTKASPTKGDPIPATPKHVGGGYYELADGERVQGKEAAYAKANVPLDD